MDHQSSFHHHPGGAGSASLPPTSRDDFAAAGASRPAGLRGGSHGDSHGGSHGGSHGIPHGSYPHETYSDEDIELVHDIVSLAESLYSTLPERDRLPTNALFLAAESILPEHGFDPENPPSHISRLIFRIGGQRSGSTLSEKFMSVLGGMGIRLEYIPSDSSSERGDGGAGGSRASPVDRGAAGGAPRASSVDRGAAGGSRVSSVDSPGPSPQPASPGLSSSDGGILGGGIGGGMGRGIGGGLGVRMGGGMVGERAGDQRGRPELPGVHFRGGPRGNVEELGDGLSLLPVEGPHPVVDVCSPQVVPDSGHFELLLQGLRESEDQKLLSNVFGTWRANACETQRKNEELMAQAVEYDNNDLRGEVLDIWQEEAADAEEERLEAEETARYEAYVAKMEKRATRTYEIYTCHHLLNKWQDRAYEEIERTAAARRHLVRKRAFEGWHAQHVEDETKVKNFILKNSLETWGQATLHHEVRHEVAAHWHEQQLCKESLHTMWEETKERQADEFYAVNLAQHCLDAWAEKARDLEDEHQVAVALDERLLLDEAVNIWHEELGIQQYDAHECTRQFLAQGVRRDMEYWQEQARLSALLKQFNTKHDKNTQCQALETWHAATQDAQSEARVADAFFLEEPTEHWENEMKLKLFIERDEHETKAAVLEQWALEEKLAWYQRYSETKTKRDTLNTFFTAARQARSERERREQEADYVNTYHTQAGVVDTWLTETDKMKTHQKNADLVNLYRTTRPGIDHWRERSREHQVRDQYYKKKAGNYRAKALVSGVLKEWPDIAEAARRQRMMDNLRQFRRKYKVELAQECLGKWLSATTEAVEARHDAHQADLYYKREDLNDQLDFWNQSAKRAQSVQQIAADAELEVYCGKWQAQLHDNQENMEDAIEYDAEKTRRVCWEKWEVQTIQHQNKRHLADTLQDKHDRRRCGELLSDWQQQAVPEAAAAAARLDPRSSTVSARRSVRQQLARSVPAARPPQTLHPPPPSASQYLPTANQLSALPLRTPLRTPLHRSLGPGLGPMLEFDEQSVLPPPDAMSTPTRRLPFVGGGGTTPSAFLPSPDERALRQRYGGGGGAVRPRRGVGGFGDIYEEEEETGREMG